MLFKMALSMLTKIKKNQNLNVKILPTQIKKKDACQLGERKKGWLTSNNPNLYIFSYF